MRPDPPVASPQAPPADVQRPPSPAPAPAPLATRPKLNLQKRTVSQAEASPSLPSGNADSKASPFGAAKPIDTSAREKEIEEKIKQRKEQEEKVKEEKRVAEEKTKEKRHGKEPGKPEQRADKARAKSNGQAKDEEQKEQNENAGKNYQILKRDSADNESEGGEEKSEPKISIKPQDDANVKPREIVRDLNGASKEESSTEQLQEEGWSTVSKPSKGRRGGSSAARAIAS